MYTCIAKVKVKTNVKLKLAKIVALLQIVKDYKTLFVIIYTDASFKSETVHKKN